MIYDSDRYKTVTKALLEMGMPPHIKGFDAVRKAVLLLWDEPEHWKGRVCSDLYPEIGREEDCSAYAVERIIRTAIEHLFDEGSAEQIRRYLGPTARRYEGMTNAAFLFTLTAYLRDAA